MSLAFYMDVHVPSAITRGLLLRKVDVFTARLTAGEIIFDWFQHTKQSANHEQGKDSKQAAPEYDVKNGLA